MYVLFLIKNDGKMRGPSLRGKHLLLSAGTSDNTLSTALGMSKTTLVSVALLVVDGNVALQDSVLSKLFHLATSQVVLLFNV